MLTEDQLIDTWQRVRGSITWTVYQRVGNQDTANEITSEAFCRAWKNRERWSPKTEGTTADSWLFRMAINLSIDYLRSFRCRTETLCAVFFEEIHPIQDPIAEIENRIHRENQPDFNTITGPCTPEQRTVLDLRYGHELTYAQIGECMGKTEVACKSLANRGLRKIRGKIAWSRADGRA
jgi:RNA polymerase sigma-70 factor (ECF subfamily)